MDNTEIDSFVRKFKLLRDAGYEASLNLKSSLGEVEISISCKVGRINPPPPPSPPSQLASNRQKKRSPSYYRRQERRRVQQEFKCEVDTAEVVDSESMKVVKPSKEADVILVSDLATVDIGLNSEDEILEADEDSTDHDEDEDEVELNEQFESDDLGMQLQALIKESQAKRENWNRIKIGEENG